MRVGVFGFLAALIAAAHPAAAGKADDTLRIAVSDWWSTLDPYQFPLDEAAVFYQTVYETLISYDERTQTYLPRLAKSWKRIDNRTLEFELRDDVRFHNGDRFDADDVVATVRYITDPGVPLRHKSMYDWVESVAKTGPYTVRITAKRPRPIDLQTIAYQFYILDSKVLAKLGHRADYGRVGSVATGPYKVVLLDRQKLVLERFGDYYGDLSGPLGAHIKRVIALPIPDRQTQIAEFMTGDIDVIRNPSADTERELARLADARVTPMHDGQLMYITLDAMGRSNNKVMIDQRVRRAFMMAIDRKALAATVIPGGAIADILDGICVAGVIGCASSTTPPAFDPAAARALLAEAGHGDGFDLELDVYEPIQEVAEAVAGQLRKIGIRATVRALPAALYVRLRSAGQLTAFLGYRPTNARPDMDDLFDFFFNGNRDYWNDPILRQLQTAGEAEFDPAKRAALYERGIDRVNRMNDILPLTDLPIVFVHTKDLRIAADPLSPINNSIRDFYWNK